MPVLKPYEPPTARTVLDIWRGPKPADISAQSWARILDMRDRVACGTIGDDVPAAALARLADEATGAADVERERADWDRLNEGDRFE